jgi:hypothetical protein
VNALMSCRSLGLDPALHNCLNPPTGEEPVAQVAQLVEHAAENRGVDGSIPSLGTTAKVVKTKHLEPGEVAGLSALWNPGLLPLVPIRETPNAGGPAGECQPLALGLRSRLLRASVSLPFSFAPFVDLGLRVPAALSDSESAGGTLETGVIAASQLTGARNSHRTVYRRVLVLDSCTGPPG